MRIIASLVMASALAAASVVAQAENAPAEPVKSEGSAAPDASAATEKPAEAARPTVQTNAAEPRKSGLDQPLCTGE